MCFDVAVSSTSHDATDNIFDCLVADNASFCSFSLNVSAVVRETTTVVAFKGKVHPKNEFTSCCSNSCLLNSKVSIYKHCSKSEAQMYDIIG